MKSTSPFLISPPDKGSYTADVIPTGSGFTVVYDKDYSYYSSAFYGQTIHINGTLQGAAFPINTDTESYDAAKDNQIGGQYRAAPVSNDSWVAVYSEFQHSRPAVVGQYLYNNGTPIGEPFTVDINSDSPAAVRLPGGGFAYLYRGNMFDGNSFDTLKGQFYNADGTKRGANFSLPYNYLFTNDRYSFAASGANLIAAAVNVNSIEQDNLWTQQISAVQPTVGQSIGGPSTLATINGFATLGPTLAFSNGVFNTLWEALVNDGNGYYTDGIYAKRSDRSSIDQLTFSSAGNIAATAIPDNKMLVAWNDFGSEYVRVQRFTQDNQADSTIYTPGTSTDCPGESRYDPALATNGNTTLLTWTETVGYKPRICGEILPELPALPSSNGNGQSFLGSPAGIATAVIGGTVVLLGTLYATRAVYKYFTGTGHTTVRTSEGEGTELSSAVVGDVTRNVLQRRKAAGQAVNQV